MNSTFTRHALAVLCGVAPFAVNAQTTPPVAHLDHIVTTASRGAELKKDVLGDVTVIDNKELENAGQSSLAEVLSRHHGIEFATSGGPQTTTSVFLRGNNSSHTLVLVDGIRVNSPNFGGVNWNTIDPATIDSIEIVRGAASSLYGSDAIGGVVNIITRKTGEDRPLRAFANVGYGTYNTFKSSIGLSGASDGWDYSLSSSLANSNGFNATRPEVPFGEYHPDKDGYAQHSLSASLGYRWKPGHHIGLTAYNGYNKGDFDSGLADPAYALIRQQAYALTSTDDITDNWQSVLRFGYSQENAESRAGQFAPYTYGNLQRSYTWQNNLNLSKNQRLSLILERMEERPASSMNFVTGQRNTNSAGLVYRADLGIHHVQASIRNDNISGYGNQTTGGLAYDVDLTPEWRIGASANTGFQAPTFNDLYAPGFGGYPSMANPDLKPAKSRNLEARLQYEKDGTKLGLVAYQNKVQDLIVGTTTRLENIDSATLRGVTLTAGQSWGNTALRASADFQDPKDDANGEQLIRRARQIYRLNATHRVQAWTLGAEYMFVGKREDDVPGLGRTRLGGYSLWNLTANYDVSKNVAVQVRWNNIMNKEYATIYGYNMPGSNVFVNLAWRM